MALIDTNSDGVDQDAAAARTGAMQRAAIYGNTGGSPLSPATPAATNPVAGGVGGAGSQPVFAGTPRSSTVAGASGVFGNRSNSLYGSLSDAADTVKNYASGIMAKVPTAPGSATPDFFAKQGMSPADASLAAYHTNTYAPAQAAASTAQMAHDSYLNSLPDSSGHLLPLSERVNRLGVDPTSGMNEAQSKAYDTYSTNLQSANDALAKVQPQYDQLSQAAHAAGVANQAQGIINAQGDKLTVPAAPVSLSPTSPIPISTPASGPKPIAPVVSPQSSRAQSFVNAQGNTVSAPAGISVSKDANGNPIFSGTGQTVAAAGGVQPDTVDGSKNATTQGYTGAMPFGPRSDYNTPVDSSPGMQPQFGNSRNAANQAVNDINQQSMFTRGDAYSGLNPTSDAAEAMRRAQIDGTSYALKGMPRERQMIMEGDLGMNNEAQASSMKAQDAAQSAINQGADAQDRSDLEQQDANNRSSAQTQDQQFHARMAQNEQQPMMGSDGTLFSRNGNATTQVVGPDGKPFKPAAGPNPQDAAIVAAYQAASKNGEVPPELESAARGAFARMAGQSGAAPPPPPAAAVTYLKANPKMRSAFDTKYGAGASDQVLGKQ